MRFEERDMSVESRFQIAAGWRVRLRLLVCAPIAVVFVVIAVVVTLFAGVASTAAGSGGGVFGPLIAPGVSPSFVSGGGDPSFGEPGEGAGQIGSPHSAPSGHTEVVGGLAIDHVTRDVYVADAPNRRIDEFSEAGKFERAWGWGVDKARPEAKLQECTVATGCQKGEAGGGAGELSEPVGIAVGGEAGSEAVYVLESGISGGNDRVQEFTPAGAFVRMWGGGVKKGGADICEAAEAGECQAGREGTGSGEFKEVGLQGAIAVGPTGLVYVGDAHPTADCSTEPECGHVQRFEADGKFVSSFPVATEGEVEALAVTSGGEVCLTVNSSGSYKSPPAAEVRCYSSTGVLEHTFVLEEQPKSIFTESFIGLAADGSGHLFVDEYLLFNPEGLTVQAVFEYSETGVELERLLPPGGDPSSREREPGGFALNESAGAASGTLVVSRQEAVVHGEALPPAGPVVIGQKGTAGEPASTATLSATIDPENHASEYRFEYAAEGEAEHVTATAKLTADGFEPETVQAQLSGLKASTLYHFHVVAEDSEHHVVDGSDQTFTTLPPLRVDTVSVGEVSAEGATLQARVDPLGSAGEYRFEYAAEGEAEHETATLPIVAGKEDVTVSAHVQGLRPDTAYAYRVIAGNSLGQAQPLEARLVTQPAGAPFALLDGRAWEQVSPPDKGPADISLFGGDDDPVRAAANGDAVTYISEGGSEAEPQGEPKYAQNVSRHGAGGWSTRDISSPNAQRYTFALGELSQYRLFSEDLRDSVLEPSPYTSLSRWTSEQPEKYLRDEAKCPAGVVTLTQVQESECFVPLLTDEGPFADVKEGVRFGNEREDTFAVKVNEATPDLSHIVLAENGESTTPELVAGAGSMGLYEWSAGRELAPLSLTPQGTACERAAIGAPATVGDNGSVSRNALSPDGEFAVWSPPDNAAAGCAGHLYLRDVAKEKTVQLDEVQSGSGAGGPAAYYQDASVGDEHIFFTDSQRLTEGSTGLQGPAGEDRADLYEYSFDRTSDTGSLIDMTKPVVAGEAAGVIGVTGASEDGSVVYAIATGVLSAEANAREEHAVSGEHNLYKLERAEGSWKATFITVLAASDEPDWGVRGESGSERVAFQTTRVSPDGKWLAFMSDRSLTGYDNEDVTSKTPGERMDEEVFLYDAVDNRVMCASCNPTGTRPAGIQIPNTAQTFSPLIDSEEPWREGRWLSGGLPVPYTLNSTHELAVRQPRYLSNGGRLFFNSTDGLVPSDRNGVADAYEYESPANTETATDGANDTCTPSSATYSQAAEGCIDLISSGASPEESVFLEASENGNDVFFLTAEKLAASDVDSAYDVYDAHVCGSGWECPAPSVVSPPCTGTESCRGAPAGQPSLYGSPASATFSGPGNSVGGVGTNPPVVKPKPKAKPVKCKRGLVKNKKGKCVKKPKKKNKAKKSAHINRRASR
jgi:hypothetical protein